MTDRPTNRWAARAGGLGVAVWTLALMIATEPHLAIAWDEGYSLGREARVRAWFRAVRDPEGFAATWTPPRRGPDAMVEDALPPPRAEEIDRLSKLLRPRVLAWFWPFAREEPHGHPPFYAVVGLVGDVLAPSWATLPRARLGSMLAFSLTAGALFAFAARRWGYWAAAAAVGAWLLQPRLFAEGHYATYDALLAGLWVGAILAFASAVEPGATTTPRWGWAILFGVLAGWAADTKLTGWLLPLPFAAWTLLYRDRRGALTLLVGAPIGLATLYTFNPAWWGEPIAGVERFLRSNLTRHRTIPIPVLFLGRVIETPTGSLPWYNTLAWTVLVTPAGFLFLALAGAVRAVRAARAEPFGVLALGHWAFLLLLRALPHTPGHDGVRQFLPAFGCLAIVAGIGAAGAVERLGRWGRAAIVAAVAEGALSVAVMMPVPLSYYSPIVLGLPGAAALGMEPTYYWDALSDDALDWLNAHAGDGRKVRFATNPSSWIYLQKTGRLRAGAFPWDPGRWAWYVVQNRPGQFRDLDRLLVARGRPSFVVRKLGVPLIWVYPWSEVEALSGTIVREGPAR